METVIIVIHLMIVLALVGVVPLQRSEGGGLGIGGGSGFMTARGASNALTRTTAILAALFFATSLGLSIMARYGEQPLDILDRVPTTQQPGGGGGILDQLGGGDRTPAPAAPAQQAPAAPGVPAPSEIPGDPSANPAPAPAAPATPSAPADSTPAPSGSSTQPATPSPAPAQTAPATPTVPDGG